MLKKYCRWQTKEIKELFSFIEQHTKTGTSLTQTFSLYARQAGRKPNSVRNYYYAELSFLQSKPQEARKLNINLDNHKKTSPKYFSKKEAENCVEQINKLISEGNSVRKACLILSDGDVGEMVRLQNKYRSMVKQQGNKNKHAPTNIISMPTRSKHLTQHEIDGLFLGLLKLIKASARQEASNELAKKKQEANQELLKVLMQLSDKEKQLKKLKNSFELLKQKNTKAQETIKQLRSSNAQKIASHEKMHALKKYTHQIKTSKKANMQENQSTN